MLKRAIAGTSSTYIEGVDKVTGKGRYINDLKFPGMLAGKLLYPEYPRARIIRINTAPAKAMPGVEAVVTHADLKGEKVFGHIVKDHQVFAVEEVYCIADVLAAVAAVDELTAEQALQAIEVEYEPLPGVFDAREALKPDAPLARKDLKSNILAHFPIDFGNVEEGFAAADVVVEHTYQTAAMDQLFMEPEGAIAVWNGDVLTVYSCGQHPHRDRIQIAEQLGLPANRVRVIYPLVGGGFGGKDELTVQTHVGLLALKSGRPVKLIRSRAESMLSHVKRHQFFIRYKTGVKRDGTITAIEVDGILDSGPYTNASLAIAGFAAEMASGPYRVPNARINGYCVATNNIPGGAMRGFGGPEMAFGQEQNIDIVAERIGMDPLEFRLKNGMEKGTLLPTGSYIHYEIGLKKTLEEAANAANWVNRDNWLVRQPEAHLRRGIGVASTLHGVSMGRNLMDHSRASLEMTPDGSVLLQSSAAEIGAGSRTALVMIAAEVLGVRMEDIRFADCDTDHVPDSGATTASRQVFMTGNAVIQAAEPIRRSLLQIAADKLEAAMEDMEISDGIIRVKGGPESARVTVKDAARTAWVTNKPLRGEGFATYWEPDKPMSEYSYPVPHTIFAYSTQIAQVLVDVETGQIKVEKIWAAHDVGKVINRLGAIGQIHGGVMQGLGTALMEELVLEDGRLLNMSLESYLSPSIMETPQIEPIIVEVPEPNGPLGAKGLAETTINPTAAAIANAVADAIGVRTWVIPMTPERVLEALTDGKQGAW